MGSMTDRDASFDSPTNLRQFIKADFHRIGIQSLPGILRTLTLKSGPHQYIFWLRVCAYLSRGPWTSRPAFVLSRLVLRRNQYRYGIDIPYTTRIGPGLYIGHGFGIVVNHDTVIGANCNLSQGVTIGQTNRGKRAGTATIGQGVYLGPGVSVVGKVHIGDNVAVGAGAVIVDDVPRDSVVVGNPGRVVSSAGAHTYVENRWPPPPLPKIAGRQGPDAAMEVNGGDGG